MIRQITSVQHPLVKHLVKLRHNRDYRYEHQSVVIEGIKPVEELGRACRFRTMVLLHEAMIPLGAAADNIILVNDVVMKKLSGMESPEGLIVEIAMPKTAPSEKMSRILAVDEVSDPGNLGSLLRSALALGWDGVFILNDSCDPYNDKALRAARGATFKIPLITGGWDDLKALIANNRLTPLVADMAGDSLQNMKHNGRVLLVMGNEAHGASKEAKALCHSIAIAMPGPMDSLNVAVAGGILMYALQVGQSSGYSTGRSA